MKRTITYFWEESPGVHSQARILSIVCMIYTFYITHLQIVNDNVSVELISLYLIASFAPKTIQKFAEQKKSAV